MRVIRVLVLIVAVILLAALTPQPVEAAQCVDCFLVNTPWGTEWVCLQLGGSDWRICDEMGDACLLMFACWLFG